MIKIKNMLLGVLFGLFLVNSSLAMSGAAGADGKTSMRAGEGQAVACAIRQAIHARNLNKIKVLSRLAEFNLNSLNDIGQSFLHLSVWEKWREGTAFFLGLGIDKSIKDLNGRTAQKYASLRGDVELAYFLNPGY